MEGNGKQLELIENNCLLLPSIVSIFQNIVQNENH